MSSEDVWKFFATDSSLQKKLISSQIKEAVKTFSKKEASGLIDSLFPSDTFSKSDKKFFLSFLSSYSGSFISDEGISNKLELTVFYESAKGNGKTTGRKITLEIKDPIGFSADQESVKSLSTLISNSRNNTNLAKREDIEKALKAVQKKIGVQITPLKSFERIKIGLTETTDPRSLEEKLFEWSTLAQLAFAKDEIELGFLFLAQIIKLNLKSLENSSCPENLNLFKGINQIAATQEKIYSIR